MNFSISFSIFPPKIAGVREILFDISKIYILSHKKEKKNHFLTEKRLEITKIEFRAKIHKKKQKKIFSDFFYFFIFCTSFQRPMRNFEVLA